MSRFGFSKCVRYIRVQSETLLQCDCSNGFWKCHTKQRLPGWLLFGIYEAVYRGERCCPRVSLPVGRFTTC